MRISILSYCVWGGVRDTQRVLDTMGEASASGRSVGLGRGDGAYYDFGDEGVGVGRPPAR